MWWSIEPAMIALRDFRWANNFDCSPSASLDVQLTTSTSASLPAESPCTPPVAIPACSRDSSQNARNDGTIRLGQCAKYSWITQFCPPMGDESTRAYRLALVKPMLAGVSSAKALLWLEAGRS